MAGWGAAKRIASIDVFHSQNCVGWLNPGTGSCPFSRLDAGDDGGGPEASGIRPMEPALVAGSSGTECAQRATAAAFDASDQQRADAPLVDQSAGIDSSAAEIRQHESDSGHPTQPGSVSSAAGEPGLPGILGWSAHAGEQVRRH